MFIRDITCLFSFKHVKTSIVQTTKVIQSNNVSDYSLKVSPLGSLTEVSKQHQPTVRVWIRTNVTLVLPSRTPFQSCLLIADKDSLHIDTDNTEG